ncbi:MATE family efflux transporter [Pacificimonas sp. WHA3]|uniref:MATE family efflux transporter n=2 Tax=Pacificimonas pallii TaxID=2827236 RepID=A0ABS6SHP2_9SPHN|nr:MATE family efflux transporter [Pacificimonas pallii]
MLMGIACMMSVGIVDAYFVGQLGPDPLAAISFIFPVTVVLSSLGVGVLVGINSVVARALGGGRRPLAERRAVQGIAFAAAFGLIVGALLLLFEAPLFQLLGAGRDLSGLISDYMGPYALGIPILLTGMGANATLRAQGAANRSAVILLMTAVTNWVLDPLLIAGWGPFPSYGIAGAAYASVGAFVLSGLVGLVLAARSDLGVNMARLKEGDWGAGAKALIGVGGPAALSNSINPVGLTILTGMLSSYGNDAVAAFGVAGRLQSMAVVPLLAMSSSIGSIVGQNWGAGKPERSQDALKQASMFCLVYGVGIAALLVLFRDAAAGLFTDDPGVIGQIGTYLMIAAWGFAGYGILIVTNGALNAVDRAPHATLVSAARVLLIMVPVAWAGSRIGDETGIYAGELAANLVGGAAAYFVGVRMLKAENCPAPSPATKAE